MSKRSVWGRVTLFYALTLLLSVPFYVLIIHAGKLLAGDKLCVVGLMWCPAMAALITQYSAGQSFSSLGWKWGATRYQAFSYLIPLAYTATVYSLVWATGLGGFYDQDFVTRIALEFGWEGLTSGQVIAGYAALRGVFGMVEASAFALGEEIGWRGFLVPNLARVSGFSTVAVVSGLMWAAWHYPILLLADYSNGTPHWYGLTCFTVMVVAISFLFAWMRLRSGSLWTAVFLHASHNLFVQEVFTPLTTDTGVTKYVIDEFGLGLALAATVVAFIVWSMRGRVGGEPSDALQQPHMLVTPLGGQPPRQAAGC